jgi:hypothetical protein
MRPIRSAIDTSDGEAVKGMADIILCLLFDFAPLLTKPQPRVAGACTLSPSSRHRPRKRTIQ